jgi:hypothetical protein
MPDPNSPFTSMVITFYTGSDDKDPNTRLEISIFTPPPGTPTLAYYDDGDNDHFDAFSTKSFTVPPAGPGFRFADLSNQVICVKITPIGHDTWRFSFSAKIYFADGTTAQLPQTLGLVLDQDANQLFYPLGGAAV